MTERQLTPKQEAFVREYMVDLNATQAAIRAGYSPKTAQEQSSRLLSNAIVSRAVAEAKAKRAEQLNLDAYWVLHRLKEVADRCMQHEPARDQFGREIPGEFVFDSKGAIRAAELIGKHLGLFEERVRHSGEVNMSFTPEQIKRMAHEVIDD